MSNCEQNNSDLERSREMERRNRAGPSKLQCINDADISNGRKNTYFYRNMKPNIYVKNYDDDDDKLLSPVIQKNKMVSVLLPVKRGTFLEENFHLYLSELVGKQDAKVSKIIIDNITQYIPSMNLITYLNAAILNKNPNIIEAVIPHCGFSKPSDLYIPRDLVIESSPSSEKCVELLLKWNFTLHPDNRYDKDLICKVIKRGFSEIVSQLFDLGIDVDLIDADSGLNILTIACLNQHLEIIENLLECNAKINTIISKDHHSRALYYLWSKIDEKIKLDYLTCLHIAVFNSDLKTMELLFKYGTEMVEDQNFFRIIDFAILYNNEGIIRLLLNHDVNVNQIIIKGKSVVYRSINSLSYKPDSQYNIVKLILEKGVHKYLQTPGNKFVFKAIINGHHKIAQLFLDYDPDIQYVNSRNGYTLLHYAIIYHFDTKFIESLLKLHSPINVADVDGRTPLHFACNTESNNKSEIIELLLENNADVNYPDNSFMTPLHYACEVGDSKFVKMLLDKGANPNAKNEHGETPLHVVSRTISATSNIIQLLLDYNADIEALDINRRTPLFQACLANNCQAIRYLLDNNANVDHIDGMNLTPLLFDVRTFGYNFKVIEILLERSANVFCNDMEGNSIIHLLVKKENIELVEWFVDTDIDFNTFNNMGYTPLHLAVKEFSETMIKCLIKYGANINILNKQNQTPLQQAFEDNLCSPWWKKDILMILITQVVKLKVAGLSVSDKNLTIAYNLNSERIKYNQNWAIKNKWSDIQKLEIECKQEIEKIKEERIIGTDRIAFYDLLKKNIRALGRLDEYNIIQPTLNQEVYDEKFPLYIDIIRCRFREGKIRHKKFKIIDSVKEHFRQKINSRLPYECTDMVMDYLNIKELNDLLTVLKLLD